MSETRDIVDDHEIWRLWREAGGTSFGPRVEHACMEEKKFLAFMRKLYERVAAAEAAAMERAAWQPIETAPKTSKGRLVWCSAYQNIYIVSWIAPLGEDAKPQPEEGFWAHFGAFGGRLNERPTHWMPLPAGPGQSIASGNAEVEGLRDNRQRRVAAWCAAAFGTDHASSLPQRGVRLLEEAIELYQACGGDPEMAHRLVDFVFGRPVGKIGQELGGVGITLLALAAAAGESADAEERRELDRVLSKPLSHFAARNAAKNAAGFGVSSKEQMP